MKYLLPITILLCGLNCSSRYLKNDIMLPIGFFKYQGSYSLCEDNNKIDITLKDSTGYLNCSINKYKYDEYIYDTLKPYYGFACTKFGPLYPCPCEHLGMGAHCDCSDCLDSIKSIIFFRGKYSQIYLDTKNLFCTIEDTTGSTVFTRWKAVFKKPLPTKKILNK